MTGGADTGGRRLRVALFGSPAFALPTLEVLRRAHDLLLVVTQSAKPAGRGLALKQPAVAERALRLAIPLEQPTRLKGNTDFRALLAALDLDVAVTAAYGRILPQDVLDVPRHGFLNVHASLLPKYRGAAPVQRALIEGEPSTGISIMQTEAGLDTGPVRLQVETVIGDDEGASALLERLSLLGASALERALALLAAGELPSEPQDDSAATLAPPLTADDGRIRWSDPQVKVLGRHRGVDMWPGSYFMHSAERVKVPALRAASGGSGNGVGPTGDGAPGEVVALTPETLVVATADAPVELLRVKPAAGREMSARAWANGRDVVRGTRLA
ncbi:MAG: methionyl-tRNA formyltransferase [Trueperaceae bacterium]|nr:methionyl-tRNA formyltransferase [Trueperaceae bacterium]